MKDLKAALGNASKPDITHVRGAIMTYIARACEYGSAKYERGNYMRPAGDTRDDFIRYGAYLRSAMSHIVKNLDRMEAHRAKDPNLEDVDGMLEAAYAADPDVTPGAKVGASMLPHAAHAAAGLMMAIVQATEYGLLPKDPGQPWAEDKLLIGIDPGAGPDRFVIFKSTGNGPVEIVEPTETWDFEADEELAHIVAEGLEPAKTAPYNPAPTCEHDIMLGRRCVRCPDGRSSETPPAKEPCPHGRDLGLACRECGGYARRELREG